MTGYIPRSGAQKKKNILSQREHELVGEIRRGGEKSVLEKKAERVRLAQLSVLKALIHELEPAKEEDQISCNTRLKKLAEKEDRWNSISSDEIISHYSNPNVKIADVGRKKW